MRNNDQKRSLVMAALACGLLLVCGFSAQAQWTTSSGNTTTTDKVGVGTNSPDTILTVTGTGELIGGTARYTVKTEQDPTNHRGLLFGYDTAGQIGVIAPNSGNSVLTFWTHNGSAWGERFRLDKDGNVGIATASPSRTLDVNGIIQSRAAGNGGGAVYFDSAANFWRISQTATGSSGKLQLTQDGIVDVMTLTGNGYVGVGTVNPADKFSIEGSASAGTVGAYVKNTAGTTSGTLSRFSIGQTNSETSALLLQFSHGDDNAVILNRKSGTGTLDLLTTGGGIHINNNGSVGIGTNSPGGIFDARGTYSYFGSVQGYTYIANDTVNFANATNGPYTGWINYYGYNNGFSQPRNLAIGNGAGTAVLTVDGSNQRVGIGTTGPSEKLEIDGNLKLTGTGNINTAGTIEAGNIKAKYQDVAEWVPSSEQLSAGTVVVLDSTKSNQVTSSTTSYDTRVAGVVSEQPGIALGEKSEGKVLVATTGRVRVKVDATKGPIRIGDLLVTSDVPGVAMKSEPVEFAGRKMHMPGTLIGKALEPLEKGKGEILVLLSLQ